MVRTSPVSPSCCQQVWGGVSPRGGDQPESMEVQRFWLFGLRRTLTSTHPRVAGRAAGGWGMEKWRGWGSPLPGAQAQTWVQWPEPTATSCCASWPGWPGGLGAGQHWPKLFGASWAWGGPGLGRRAQVNPGGPHLPLCPRAVPGPAWKGLQRKVGTHWDWPYSC